eukprot:scaffold916_cov516-Prasinococcus_capsulatus_cf.AAC.37
MEDTGGCAHVNANTGVLHFRPTNASIQFVQQWYERVTQAQENWMRDQPAFNLILREAVPQFDRSLWKRAVEVLPEHGCTCWACAVLRAHLRAVGVGIILYAD